MEPTHYSSRIISFAGLFVMMAIAWLLSTDKKSIKPRIIIGGLLLQLGLGALILGTSQGESFFGVIQNFINDILNLSDAGAELVFGKDFRDHFFAFKVTCTIIYVSALSYILFYFGLIQKVIELLARIMSKVMGVSGSESLAMAANVFVGQTEAPLLIKPFLKTMTKSELMAMMGGGMATIAGGVLAAYSGMGIDLGDLITASVMSAPAALLICKIMVPETEISPTSGAIKITHKPDEANVFEAAVNGTKDGLFLALNVAAMLIAFTAMIALVNYFLAIFGGWFGFEVTLQSIMGYIFQPLAWVMGVPWADCYNVGQLIGIKTTLNEFVAYIDLARMINEGVLSDRSITIATYALCGFANFSSIGIQIGGISSLEPSRKKDLARLGLRAMIAATLAAFMTACVAGIFV